TRDCCAFLYFFFQAEDGIRDATVTGVQTCALPISSRRARLTTSSSLVIRTGAELVWWSALDPGHVGLVMALAGGRGEVVEPSDRSEERRVGKECRCGRWAGCGEKNVRCEIERRCSG